MKPSLLGLSLVLLSFAEALAREAVQLEEVTTGSVTQPSRTLLDKRRKGGKGGSGDGEEGEEEESDEGSRSCMLESYIEPADPDHYNPLGYSGYEKKGPGSQNSIQGGYTRNGTGSFPSWTLDDGTWTYDYHPDEKYHPSTRYYFGGAIVPYEANKKSPNGLEPRLTSIDFGERTTEYQPSVESDPRYVDDCQMPSRLVVYRYPVAYNYAVMDLSKSPRGHMEWVAVGTKEITVLCVCNPKAVCGCDYPGDPDFVQALGNHTLRLKDFKTSYTLDDKNSTHVCYMPNLNGTTSTLLINGSLKKGSTKADPSMPDMPMVTKYRDPCPGAAGGDTGDSAGSLNWDGLPWAAIITGIAVSTTTYLTIFSF